MSLDPMVSLHQTTVARHLARRWCALAESRLQYLTELFESGRWRRFHGEAEFLENIHEAKAAVACWRAMAAGQPIDDLPAPWARASEPEADRDYRGSVLYEAPRAPPRLTVVAETPVPLAVSPALQPAPYREAAVSPVDLDWQSLDVEAVHARYPMLRAAM